MNAILDTTKLEEAIAAKAAKMHAMNAIVEETGEPFSDEQSKEYESLENSYDQAQKQLGTMQRANQRAAGLLNIGGARGGSQGQGGSQNQQGQIVQGGQSSQAPNNVNIRVKGPAFADDPKGGFKDIHEFLENVMIYGQQSQGRRGGDVDERINFLSSMRHAMKSPQFINDCSDGSCDPGGSTTDLTGAVFVPKEFAPDMFKVDMPVPSGAFRTTRRTSQAPQIIKKYRLDKDHRESVTGGFKVGRNFEHCCNVSSAAEYSEYQRNVHPLYGAYCASDMLLEMNPAMIIQEVQDGFRTEFEVQRLVEILNGKQFGEYAGIWPSPATIVVDPTEDSESETDISKQDIYNMTARLWRGGNRDSIVWIAGLEFQTQLKLLQDTNLSSVAHFLYAPNAGPDWADGMLDGFPIVFTEIVPGVGFQGGLGLYNLAEYEEYTWRPMRMASSMHAKFVCNETVMKFWTYTAGGPRWNSSLIPKCVPSGAEVDDYTLSPFVLLGGDPSDCPQPSRVHGKTAPAASSSSSS